MFSQDDDSQQRVALIVVFALVALVVSSVMGVGIYKSRPAHDRANMASSSAVAAMPGAAMPQTPGTNSVNTASAAQAASDAASVRVENGVVKFYFASGKADLAAGAGDALQGVIKEVKTGRKLVISGFHDVTGNAGKNAELARQRALAVRDALKAAGVTEQQIDLKKPQQMMASGSNAEARRVEVALQ